MSLIRFKSTNLLSVLALFLSIALARADLSFHLTSSTLSGVGTNEIIFAGSLTNANLTTNFLNGIQITFTNSATNYFTADTNVFFANVPGILLPGETYTDAVFGILISTNTPPGNYTGIATIQGGADIFATNDLVSQSFQISMPPATFSAVISGTNFFLSWPVPPGSFVLQQNFNLAATNWTAVTNPIFMTNFQNQTVIPAAVSNRFYRLVYP